MHNLVWLDLEMTGLNPDKERILEIATVVTDEDLNIVAEGPSLVINQPETLLASMDEWNTNQHNLSGLIDVVKESTLTECDAELETLAFLSQYVEAGESPLCGNTIGQDRRFLVKYMPKLAAFFHYRNLDVSSLKILANMWNPNVRYHGKKNASHRALQDVYDSIDELRYYKSHWLNNH